MDFGGIIRRAWQISWRNKPLWVLGLFAGATGGGYSGWGGTGYRFDRNSAGDYTSWPGIRWDLSDAGFYVQDWIPVAIAVLVILVLVGVFWMVLSVAAQAGLVCEVDEIEQGRLASLRAGWSKGFHYWGRVVIVGFALMLPIALLVIALLAIVVVGIIAAAEGWGSTVIGLLVVLAIVGAALVPVLIVLGFVFSNMYALAIRYVVLENRTPLGALGASWGAIRHRFKDVFLMWLVMLALGIGLGLAMAFPTGALGVGVVLAGESGAWPVSVILGLVLLAIAVVVGAFWGTYSSAAWTLFFHALTGRDAAGARLAYSVASPPGAVPPVPAEPRTAPYPPGPPMASPDPQPLPEDPTQ